MNQNTPNAVLLVPEIQNKPRKYIPNDPTCIYGTSTPDWEFNPYLQLLHDLKAERVFKMDKSRK